MGLLVREVDLDRDYGLLCHWWDRAKWAPVPRMFLPYGQIVMMENAGACAGFLYFDVATPICWMEWIIANPEIRHDERSHALDTLVTSLCNKAYDRGCKAIFSSVKNVFLSSRLKNHQFLETDVNVTHMVRLLNGSNN